MVNCVEGLGTQEGTQGAALKTRLRPHLVSRTRVTTLAELCQECLSEFCTVHHSV